MMPYPCYSALAEGELENYPVFSSICLFYYFFFFRYIYSVAKKMYSYNRFFMAIRFEESLKTLA